MATVAISLRIPEADLAELDRRASAHRMTRTPFILGAALADDLERTADEERLASIEGRLARVEAATCG